MKFKYLLTPLVFISSFIFSEQSPLDIQTLDQRSSFEKSTDITKPTNLQPSESKEQAKSFFYLFGDAGFIPIDGFKSLHLASVGLGTRLRSTQVGLDLSLSLGTGFASGKTLGLVYLNNNVRDSYYIGAGGRLMVIPLVSAWEPVAYALEGVIGREFIAKKSDSKRFVQLGYITDSSLYQFGAVVLSYGLAF